MKEGDSPLREKSGLGIGEGVPVVRKGLVPMWVGLEGVTSIAMVGWGVGVRGREGIGTSNNVPIEGASNIV